MKESDIPKLVAEKIIWDLRASTVDPNVQVQQVPQPTPNGQKNTKIPSKSASNCLAFVVGKVVYK